MTVSTVVLWVPSAASAVYLLCEERIIAKERRTSGIEDDISHCDWSRKSAAKTLKAKEAD